MHKLFFVLLMHYELMHNFVKTPLKSGSFKDALSYGHLKIFSAIDVVESHNLNLYEHEVLAAWVRILGGSSLFKVVV